MFEVDITAQHVQFDNEQVLVLCTVAVENFSIATVFQFVQVYRRSSVTACVLLSRH